MASSIFFASPILLAMILVHLLLVNKPTCNASITTRGTQTGLRVTLTHLGSDKVRPSNRYTLNSFSNAKKGKKIIPGLPIKSGMKEFKDVYTMKLALGTPLVHFSGVMDTGSDLIWTQCKSKMYFDPSKSSSFSKINETACTDFQLTDCKQKYADGSSVKLSLGKETITIGNAKIPNVIFACGIPSDNKFDGVVGLGCGNLSLISQLEKRVFSYCLASRFPKPKPSIFLTESVAIRALANTNMKVQTIPLYTQQGRPYYYISLEGISVGKTRLPVTKSDFVINNANEDGGMIIDSGTTFTYLEKRIVEMIYNEFMNQTKLKKLANGSKTYTDLQNCFKPPNDRDVIPELVFHFEGANWELPRQNYIYQEVDHHVACLTIAANHNDEKMSIFGNMQQQNMMVLYDLDKNSLSFSRANCHDV